MLQRRIRLESTACPC